MRYRRCGCWGVDDENNEARYGVGGRSRKREPTINHRLRSSLLTHPPPSCALRVNLSTFFASRLAPDLPPLDRRLSRIPGIAGRVSRPTPVSHQHPDRWHLDGCTPVTVVSLRGVFEYSRRVDEWARISPPAAPQATPFSRRFPSSQYAGHDGGFMHHYSPTRRSQVSTAAGPRRGLAADRKAKGMPTGKGLWSAVLYCLLRLHLRLCTALCATDSCRATWGAAAASTPRRRGYTLLMFLLRASGVIDDLTHALSFFPCLLAAAAKQAVDNNNVSVEPS